MKVSDEVKDVCLRPWEEIKGVCRTIEKGSYSFSIIVGKLRVVFPSDSPEAEILRREADEGCIGKKVSVLKTDSPSRPLVFKVST